MYTSAKAQTRYQSKAKLRCKKHKITPELFEVIMSKLKILWSPRTISGRLKREGLIYVSDKTIYSYLKRHNLKKYLINYNKRGGSRKTHQRVFRRFYETSPVQSRPKAAELRTRIGDWERDTMYCKGKMVLVCVDRKSRYCKIKKVTYPYTASSVMAQTKELILSTQKPLHTLTNDNGPEFRTLDTLDIPTYFCEPRKPQQRGSVENLIGLMREYLPRKTDLNTLSENDMAFIENQINHRPRQILQFASAYETFHSS